MHLLTIGRYMTVLSGTTLRFNAERWSLEQLPIDLRIPGMPVTVFTLKGRTITPVAQVFVRMRQGAREIRFRISGIGRTGESWMPVPLAWGGGGKELLNKRSPRIRASLRVVARGVACPPAQAVVAYREALKETVHPGEAAGRRPKSYHERLEIVRA